MDQENYNPNAPYCMVHGGNQAAKAEFLHLNDPKNYKFLPPNYTRVIKPAGKFMGKS